MKQKIITQNNIDERKQMEEALQVERNKLQSIIDAIADGLTIQDRDYNIIYQNEPVRMRHGDHLGEKCYRVFEGKEKICDGCPVEKAFEDGKSHTTERRVVLPSGEVTFWEITANPIRDAGGRIVSCVEVPKNITERKRIEEALQQSKENFKAYLESAPDGVYISDLKGTFLYGNKKAEEIIGYEREELLGKSFLKLRLLSPKYLAKASKLLALNAMGKSTGPDEFALIKKDGTRTWVEITTTPIKQGEEKTEVIGFVRDSSERKQIGEALQAERNKLQSIIGAMEDGLTIQDRDYNIIYQNEPLKKIFGDHLGEKCYRVFEGKEKICDGCLVEEAFKDGKSHISERKRVTPSGKVSFWEIRSTPIRDARGRIVSCLEITRNVTEHKQAEELYHTLANSSPVGVYIVQDGKFQFVNPQFQKYTGFSEDKLLGTESLKLVHPEDRERVRESAVAMLKGKRLAPYELRYIVKSGETLWATETATSIQYKGERATLGNFMDISERKRAEETLRQSKDKLRQMFESVTDGILVIDLNGVITEVNQRAVEMHGYKSKGELFGKSAVKLVAPRDHERIATNMREAVKRGKIESMEYTLLKANGTEFPAELSTSVLRNALGKPVAHITIVRDITERKQMEEALRESQEFSSSLQESSPNPIAVMDVDTSMRYINPAFEKLTGFTSAEIVGRKAPYPFWPQGKREELTVGLQKTIARGGGRSERMFQKKNGEPFWVEMTSVSVRQEGKPAYFLLNWLDITERKRMEQQLKQQMEELQAAYQKLQELDHLKDSFLSTVSHELRTPLTSIKSFSEILLNYDEDKETQREFLNIINVESDRLTRLINDFLDLSKIEAGRMQWETAELSLSEVIQMALNATQALAIETKLKVDTELSPELPTVWGDKDRLVQVVTNLLSNAIKFTPEGGKIRVKAQLLNGSKPRGDPDMVMVSVADSGIGIDPKDHKGIFEKFKQVGDTLSGKPKGTGLGLPICKEIVEHYGGRLWVESKPGKGSTFFFTLPITLKTEAEAPQAKEEEARKEEAKTAIKRGKTILVVDDEANIRRFLKHELTNSGYHVLEASGGKEAIDLARKHHPDLITLDIVMPDISGHDVIALLKIDPSTKDIPILVLSIVEEKEKAYRLGANDFVTKPFTMKALTNKINQLLQDTQKRLLVVDDDKPLVKSLKYRLEKKGFSIYAAYGGKEALKMAESHLPDLVLLDIVMPEMDGYEVMKALKKKPNTAQIPIVVMTGVENVEGKVQALSVGATKYLHKSSGFDELLKTIEGILYSKSGG